MKKNRNAICGRNTTTAPTPATAPSTSRLRSGPAGHRLVVGLALLLDDRFVGECAQTDVRRVLSSFAIPGDLHRPAGGIHGHDVCELIGVGDGETVKRQQLVSQFQTSLGDRGVEVDRVADDPFLAGAEDGIERAVLDNFGREQLGDEQLDLV